MKTTICLAGAILLSACSAPPPPPVPALTPEQATTLLHFNNKAASWMIYVKKQNPVCGYKLDLPDQLSHPTEIDIPHIVSCGSVAAPKEFDASVVFVYDKAAGKWTVERFSS